MNSKTNIIDTNNMMKTNRYLRIHKSAKLHIHKNHVFVVYKHHGWRAKLFKDAHTLHVSGYESRQETVKQMIKLALKQLA